MIIPNSDRVCPPNTEGVWAQLGSLTFQFSEVTESEGRASVNQELGFLVLLQKWLGDLGEREPETLSELLTVFTSVSLLAGVFETQSSLHPSLIPLDFFPFS